MVHSVNDPIRSYGHVVFMDIRQNMQKYPRTIIYISVFDKLSNDFFLSTCVKVCFCPCICDFFWCTSMKATAVTDVDRPTVWMDESRNK